jgi:hypothetical protein
LSRAGRADLAQYLMFDLRALATSDESSSGEVAVMPVKLEDM